VAAECRARLLRTTTLTPQPPQADMLVAALGLGV
jgi:hypothetical protein